MPAVLRRFSFAALAGALIAASFVTIFASSANASVNIEVRVGDASVVEGNGPENVGVVLPVQFSSQLGVSMCVFYSTANGTAVGGRSTPFDGTVDFVNRSGVVKVGAGRSIASLPSAVFYDIHPEPGSPETYSVNITAVTIFNGESCRSSTNAAAGVVLTKGSGTVSIVDDDSVSDPYGVRIGDISTTEGNGPNNIKVALPVRLNSVLPFAICAVWSTSNGTAVGSGKPVHDGSADFVVNHGSVMIPALRTLASIGTVVLYDTVGEPGGPEIYSVNITEVTAYNGASCATSTAPSGVSVLKGAGTVTIADDDITPTLPDPPTDLTASLIDPPGSDAVQLSWTAPANDGGLPITGYTIFRSDDGGTIGFLHIVDTNDQNTSYQDVCYPGNVCIWQVYARNALGAGFSWATSNTIDRS